VNGESTSTFVVVENVDNVGRTENQQVTTLATLATLARPPCDKLQPWKG